MATVYFDRVAVVGIAKDRAAPEALDRVNNGDAVMSGLWRYGWQRSGCRNDRRAWDGFVGWLLGFGHDGDCIKSDDEIGAISVNWRFT